jgi:D-alanyl-D-alanine dipeptidase
MDQGGLGDVVPFAAALDGAGLVNYPPEWWHWSFGDRYRAMVTGARWHSTGPANSLTGPCNEGCPAAGSAARSSRPAWKSRQAWAGARRRRFSAARRKPAANITGHVTEAVETAEEPVPHMIEGARYGFRDIGHGPIFCQIPAALRPQP